jgi:hypothetical protein
MMFVFLISGCTKETTNPMDSAIVNESWRKVGPVELGMTEAVFKKVTNIEPEYYHEAVEGETLAEIDVRKFPGIFPSVFYHRSKEYEYWMACRFLNGILFEISYTPPAKNAKELILAFTAKYGAPTSNDDWPNGFTWTQWIKKDTILSIGHVRVKGDAFPLNQPVGTATEVKIADRLLEEKYLQLVETKPKH